MLDAGWDWAPGNAGGEQAPFCLLDERRDHHRGGLCSMAVIEQIDVRIAFKIVEALSVFRKKFPLCRDSLQRSRAGWGSLQDRCARCV